MCECSFVNLIVHLGLEFDIWDLTFVIFCFRLVSEFTNKRKQKNPKCQIQDADVLIID